MNSFAREYGLIGKDMGEAVETIDRQFAHLRRQIETVEGELVKERDRADRTEAKLDRILASQETQDRIAWLLFKYARSEPVEVKPHALKPSKRWRQPEWNDLDAEDKFAFQQMAGNLLGLLWYQANEYHDGQEHLERAAEGQPAPEIENHAVMRSTRSMREPPGFA